MILVPGSARADQIADLKGEATAISQRLIQDQLQIGAYQQQYSVASEKVAGDGRAIAHIGLQIGQDEQQINKDTSEARQLAIKSYMDGGVELSGSDAGLFTGNVETVQVANEYTAIAAGNIETALDQLHKAQRILQVHQATLRQQQIQDQSDQTQKATDLRQANSTERQMASEQAQVTGQLAVAVAEQAAAQAAAASAAVAAAQKAAAQATATGATSASGLDPALNPYLQCVVQAESGGNYAAVSPNGLYMGAFQFSQPTWNMAARAAGRPDLVGVPPNLAPKADQDALAVALYALDGQQPWLGDRCSS